MLLNVVCFLSLGGVWVDCQSVQWVCWALCFLSDL